MTNTKHSEAVSNALQKRIRTFSRVEKFFYGAIILTAITMAISIIFLQSRNLQVQQQISELNSDINAQKTELNNAKQEVSELTQKSRVTEIANQAGLKAENATIAEVE